MGKKPNPEFAAKVARFKAGDSSALDGMTRIARYRYPAASDSPEVKLVLSRAGRVGRALLARPVDAEVVKRRRRLLLDAMLPLPMHRLMYWRDIDMISPKWEGATGGGHHWAVASAEVNAAADAVLRDKPMFTIVE